MKRIPLLAAMLLIFGGSVQAQSLHRNRPAPPDSFLKFKVYSVDELVREARSDPRIRLRYANFFHVPPSRVIDYMRANLVASYVPETRAYTVYCARADGTVYPVKQVFQRGTKVFALRNGQPVMKWACGNPLAHFLPAVEVKTVPVTHTVVKVGHSIEVLTPAETDVLVPSEEETPVYKPAVPALVSPLGATSRAIYSSPSSHTPLWPLLLLPIPFAFHHSSGSSSPAGGAPSGTTGQTTTGATTGVTTGSTTGTSTGATTGVTTGTSTTGVTTGSTTGTSTGATTGVTTGTSTGATTGSTTGTSTGVTTGSTTGTSTTGVTTGSTTGTSTGATTGSTTGTSTTGVTTGSTTGTSTGATTGSTTGISTTGVTTGSTTGTSTGATTGSTTGTSTTGVTTGSTTGTSTGVTTGSTTGTSTGATTGSTIGTTAGVTTGSTSGVTSGGTTGVTTGSTPVPEPGPGVYLIAVPLAALWVGRKRLMSLRKRGS